MKTILFFFALVYASVFGQQTTTIFVQQASILTLTITPTNVIIIPTNTPPPIPTNPPPVITGVFASPTGTPTGTGTQSSPWDLQTGLGKVTSGQTLWLRGGRYNGAYRSASRGSASAPIHVRQFPGEHAQLDGKGFIAQTVLTIASVHTWYWDFEVFNSQTNRYSPEADSHPTPANMPNGDGVQIEQSGDSGTGDKFINLVVHDTRQGFSLWKEAADCEMYGCLVYYNGWLAPDRGHGYGTYQQNGTGRRTMRNCFLWSGFESGFVGYGGDTAPLKNFDLDQNTIFNTAALAGEPNRCFLVGGGQVVENSNFRSNVTWCPNIVGGTGINLGYADAGAGSVNCVVSFNSFFGGKDLSVRAVNLTFANNFLAASPVTFPAGQGNTIVSTMPSDVRVFVRPHQYTPGRSHVTIYSGGTSTTATVTAASLGLANGDHFEQRSVQNFYGSAQQRTVSGANVSFDLNSGPIAQPSGWPATGTAPKFNGFVVQKL